MFGLTPYSRRHYDLATYNPFREFENLEKQFFGSTQLGEFKTDVKDIGSAFELEADLPGFKKEDINIDINGDCLTISAQRNVEHDEKDKNGDYVYRERSFGAYSRSFDVTGIKTSEIAADYNDGVLKLTLPKQAQEAVTASRRLEIR